MSVQYRAYAPLSATSKRKRPSHSTLPDAAQSTRKRSSAEPAEVPLSTLAELPTPGKAKHVQSVPSSHNSAGDHRRQGRTGMRTEATRDGSRQPATTKPHDRIAQSRQFDDVPQSTAHTAEYLMGEKCSLRDCLSDLAKDATILGFHESALLLARAAAHISVRMYNK